MMQSGEIINLIIRDESIHGVYIGLLAQEIFNRQDEKLRTSLSFSRIIFLRICMRMNLGILRKFMIQ